MINKIPTKFLTSLYSFANRSGLLRIPILRRGYNFTYFLYKKFLEDPYANLAKIHPEFFQNGHIIDVGANIGYTAHVFSRLLTAGFKVFAFEPDLENFNSLNMNIHFLKALEKITAIRSAVGDYEGQISLWINRDHSADHRVVSKRNTVNYGSKGETVEVPLVSLDHFSKSLKGSKIAFIKIDVQGSELSVSQGMRKTLEENPQAVIGIEYAPSELLEFGTEPIELLNFFTNRNYSIYVLERDGSLLELTHELLARKLNTRPYLDVVCKKESQT